jgi:hypothetical protein
MFGVLVPYVRGKRGHSKTRSVVPKLGVVKPVLLSLTMSILLECLVAAALRDSLNSVKLRVGTC